MILKLEMFHRIINLRTITIIKRTTEHLYVNTRAKVDQRSVNINSRPNFPSAKIQIHMIYIHLTILSTHLLPPVIEPQIPVFFPDGRASRLDTITLQGFSIPVVTPIGPAPTLPGNASRDLWAEVKGFRSESSLPEGYPLMCGQYEIKAGEEITLQSPYFPSKYTSFSCIWVFRSTSGKGFMLNCPEFMLGRGDRFTTVTLNQKNTFKKYVWGKGPTDQLLAGPEVKVVFRANRWKNAKGFSCSLKDLGAAATTTTTSTTTTRTTQHETKPTTASPITSTTTPAAAPTTTTTVTTRTTAAPTTTTTVTTRTTAAPTTTTTLLAPRPPYHNYHSHYSHHGAPLPQPPQRRQQPRSPSLLSRVWPRQQGFVPHRKWFHCRRPRVPVADIPGDALVRWSESAVRRQSYNAGMGPHRSPLCPQEEERRTLDALSQGHPRHAQEVGTPGRRRADSHGRGGQDLPGK
nr:uncharacterized protein LOC113818309 [Penaeus vannamei]